MSLLSRLASLFRSHALDADLEAELRSHIEMRTGMNIQAGMAPEEARRDALLRFGNTALIQEETRRIDIVRWIESLGQDVRYAFRMFRKSVVFTAVALLTLTLGIGSNTAIFTLTHAMLLRNLPVGHPEELARIMFAKPDLDFGLSGPMFDEIKKRQQVYSGVLAWSVDLAELSDGGEVRKVYVGLASGDALAVLGVRPVLGRALTQDDDKPGGAAGWTGMLAYNYWISRFNGDPSVLGRTLAVNGAAITIVGVLPRDFDGVQVGNHPIAVLPLEFETNLHPQFPIRHRSGALWLTVMGRLKPGVQLAHAREEIERIGAGILHDTDPEEVFSHGFFAGSRWNVEPGGTGRLFARSQYRQPLLFLQVLVGLILLICCANVAGLMLGRSSARRHEFAVRAALGASRMRMIRQLCVEGGLIALAGAAAGLSVAKLTSGVLLHILMGRNALQLDLAPDRGILLFTISIGVLATVLSAVPSAMHATRVQPVDDLKAARHAGPTRTRAEAWLVTTQVALSVVLLVAAGLLARNLHHLLSIDPGFSAGGVVTFPTDFSKQGKNGQERLALYEQLLQRVAALPGIRSASAQEIPLLSGWSSSTKLSSVLPDGSIRKDDGVYYNRIGPQYFATAGTRIIAGRDVHSSDRLNSPSVCWLNQSAAAFFFPAGNPVGQVLAEEGTPVEHCQIAGVVQDTKYGSLRETPRRIVYWPLLQQKDEDSLLLLVHTENIAAATAEVRHLMHDMAPTTPFLDAVTMRDLLHESIGREEVTAMLAMFFGGLALLLAAVGVYGLLSYQVVRQTRDIGVRIALGADRRDVLRLVVWRAGLLTVIGLAAGLAASLVVARLLSGLLFEIRPQDPAVYVFATAVLLAAALVASYIPAHRAARVDPMVVLHDE